MHTRGGFAAALRALFPFFLRLWRPQKPLRSSFVHLVSCDRREGGEQSRREEARKPSGAEPSVSPQ